MEKKYINLPDLLEHLGNLGITVNNTTVSSLNPPKSEEDEATMRSSMRAARRVNLTSGELDSAIESLTRSWPQIEKRYADPPIHGQQFCLFSFMPAKGAKPDENGIYGYIKVRGTFESEADADAHAEDLLNNVSAFHAIHTAFTGNPVPLVHDNDDRFTLEVSNIGVRDSIKNVVKQDMMVNARDHRDEQKRLLEEAKQRAQEEQEKEKRAMEGNPDPVEKYTECRVKRANVIFSIVEMFKVLKRSKDTVNATEKIIREMDKTDPTLAQIFLEKYNKAAEAAGVLPEKNHIIRYLAGDIPFDINLIPDDIKITYTPVPGFENRELPDPHAGTERVIPVDLSNLDYGKIAQEMTEKAEKDLQPSGAVEPPSGAVESRAKSAAESVSMTEQ